MVGVPPVTTLSLPLSAVTSGIPANPTQPRQGLPLLLGPSPDPQSPTLTSPTLSLRASLESLVPGERMVLRGRRDALDPLETLGLPGSWERR